MHPTKTDYPYIIEASPDYGLTEVTIPAGKTLKVEASAMAWMDSHLDMKTKMGGGLSRMLTGESLFINEFTAQGKDGIIGIAPGAPGDLAHVYLENESIFLQNSAYVASNPDLNVDSKFQGLRKGFFSGERMFMIKVTGTGDLWFNTYGAMLEIDVSGDYVVDTGYIVGFTEGLTYDVRSVGGMKSLFFSGEGMVCHFTGTGKVWIQTRLSSAFARWAHPYRRVKKKG
jgi:uncharacterized protein (TIGR00266 family)